MTSKATEDGSSLLASYRKEKRKSHSSINDDDSDALSDGSLLAFKFFESKVGSSAGESGESPIDFIRLAAVNMDRLQIREEDQEIADEIRGLLQAAEEGMIEKLSEMHGRLSFVDSDGAVKSRIDDSFLRKYDLSRDMNDTDIDHYEDIVNDLADKLEKMNSEKSDLQLIRTALGERLQRLSKEKDDALQAATSSFEKERYSLESKIFELEAQIRKLEENRLEYSLDMNESILDPSMAPQRKILEQYMKNQLELNSEEIEQYEQMINNLVKKLDANEEEITSWKQKCNDLRKELESSVAKSDLQDVNMSLSACKSELHELILRNRELSSYELSLDSFVTSIVGILSVDFEVSSLPGPSSAATKWDSQALDTILSKLQSVKTVVLSNSVPRVEFDKAQIRLEAKVNQVEDLSAELQKLQSALDIAEKELDQYKMNEMKTTATNRLSQLDKDNELEILRSRVMELQEKEQVLEEELDSLERQLAEAVAKNSSLKSVLERFEEKEAATEDLLGEIQDKCKMLLDENDELHSELQTTQELLAASSARVAGDHVNELKSLTDSYDTKVSELRQVIDQQSSLLSEANTLNNQLKAELLDYKQRSKGLQLELDDQRRLASSAQSLTPALSSVASNLLGMHDVMEIFYREGLDSTLRHLEMKLSSAEESVQDLKLVLKSKDMFSSDDIKERMIETQRALSRALAQHDEDSAERDALLANIRDLEEELERVRSEQIVDPSMIAQVKDHEETILRLKRLLVAAERRVSSAAADQAQKFAQSARIIGYLESECFRLHGLCDYFKATNAKLTGELKKAFTNSIRQNHSESIALALTEQKEEVEEKLEEMQMTLSTVRREHTYEMNRLEEEYRSQLIKLNSDLESMFTQLSMKETEVAELQSTFKSSQGQFSDIERALRDEVTTLKANFTESEKRRIMQARELSEKDSELNDLLAKLREASMHLTQLDERQKLLLNDSEAKKSLDEQYKSDLLNELQEAKNRVVDLESKLTSVSTKLTAREEMLVKKEAEVADHVLKSSMLSDENSNLMEEVKLLRDQVAMSVKDCDAKYLELDSYVQKIHRLEQTNAKFASQITDFERICKEKDSINLELRDQIDVFTASVSALEMRDKFNNDEISNAGQVISELRLEVEALRTIVDDESTRRSASEALVEDYKSVTNQLKEKLLDSEREYSESESKLKQVKSDLRSTSEKLSSANEALEKWSIIRLKVVDCLRDMLVAWEGQCRSEMSPAMVSQLRERLPLLLTEDEPVSTWTNYFLEKRDLVTAALASYKNKVEEMEILLHGAHLQHVAVEESLKASQAELRMYADVQLRCQKMEEDNKELQQSNANMSRSLEETKSAQEFLFQRIVAARQKVSALSKEAGLQQPSSVYVASSMSLDSFNREMGEFEDSIVALINFLEGKGNELQFIVKDLEDTHRDTINKLTSTLSKREEDIANLMEKVEELNTESYRQQSDLEAASRSLESFEAENRELRELEARLQGDVDDLQNNLNEADAIIARLTSERDQLAQLSSNNNHDVRALETELDLFRKRMKSCELQLESTASSNQRLKAERDALESLNLSMKMELERVRSENSALSSSRALTDALPHLMVEFDRLLLATENLVVSESTATDVTVFSAEHETTLASKIQNYSTKVSRVVALLGKLSLAVREERKKLKSSEDQLARLKSEVNAQKDLISQLNSDISHKNDELSRLIAQSKSSHELEKLENVVRALEKDLKEAKSQLSEANKLLDMQQKSSSRLQLEVNAKNDEIASLRRQLQAMKASMQMESSQRELEANKNVRALEEIESLMLQLDASRQNCEKMSSSVKHLEASLAHERSLRHASETKVAEMSTVYSRHQNTDMILQSTQRERESLQTANQTLTEANAQLEEKMKLLNAELELSRRRTQSLESRLQSVLSDRDNFLQKITETQAKLHQANILSVRERPPAPVDKTHELRNETSSALVMTSDQTKDLKNTINQLTTEVEERETKLTYEKRRRAALEKELESIKSAQSKLQEENEKLKNYSASFRSEGREARKDILEISGAVCEMIVHMRMDLQMSPATKKIFSLDELDGRNDSDYLKLSEALGIHELLGSVKSMRDTYGQLRDEWRRLRQKEEDLSLLEIELGRLRRQLDESESYKSMTVTKHSEDIKYWQQKYTELQSISSSSTQLKKRVSDLEKILNHEQNLKEKAIAELDMLREQVEKLQSSATLQSTSRFSADAQHELQHLQNEYAMVRAKLDIANEGNAALQATTHHLEDRLLQGQTHQGEDAAQGNKLHQSDIVVDIYRTMLFSFVNGIGLTASGAGQIQVQYDAVLNSVENMVHALRKYYDEEVEFLNTKLNTTFHQYREAKVYGGELNRQMEEQVKALFRSGKGSISEFMMKEREKLKFEVEKVQQELIETEQQLLEDQERMRAKISRMALDVVNVVKDRDEVAASLSNMENFCFSRGFDVNAVVAHQKLTSKFWRPASEQARNGRSDMAAKKTIDTLMRGLIEADQELLEAERKAKRTGDTRRTLSTVPSSSHQQQDDSRKFLSETFLTSQHTRVNAAGGTVFDLQTMDRGRGSSSLRISKSKR